MLDQAFTDQDGYYTSSQPLFPRNVLVRFEPPNGLENTYLPEYYDNGSTAVSAQRIALQAGSTITADASLERGGRITGQVTAADNGAGLGGVQVQAYDVAGGLVSETLTSSIGSYSLGANLRPGTYRIRFRTDSPDASSQARLYSGEFYNDTLMFSAATGVTVAAGTTTAGINAQLSLSVPISGWVAAADTTIGLSDILVEALLPDGTVAAAYITGATGRYQLNVRQDSSYRLLFTPIASGVSRAFVPEFYNDSSTFEGAQPVAPTASGRDGVNCTLARGSQFVGRITSDDLVEKVVGSAVGGVVVTIYDNTGAPVARGTTNSSGSFITAPGVRLGTYRIGLRPPPHDTVSGETFVPGKRTLAEAEPVIVSAVGFVEGLFGEEVRRIYLPAVRR